MAERDSNPDVPWRLLIVIAGVAVGYWALSPTVLSSRPEENGGAGTHLLGNQDVEARLWQDPIFAVGKEDSARLANPVNGQGMTLGEIGSVLAERRSGSP